MTINVNKAEIKELHPRILILGVGGAGGNAINGMIEAGLEGVEFIAVNTDAQDLNLNKAKAKIQIGANLTNGLGAGARLDVGQAAADESLNDIINFLQGANMVFITAGMGGGTGTGAAHVIARAAKELNILTVGVVTLPFLYEGPSRMRRANQGLEELRKHVDTIIVIPNQNLFKVVNENTTLEESFVLSNNVLKHGVQSVTDLMVKPGLINLDFADVENIMKSMGKAMMGTGEAEGEKRALQSAELALNNPLIDEYSLQGAKGLLVNITGGKDLKLFEVEEAVNKVRAEVDSDAEVIIGSITDSSLDGKMRVSIVATSLDGISPEEKSVVSMVHRIQNRNYGYLNPAINPNVAQVASNEDSLNSAPIYGANALKMDHDLDKESVPAERNNADMGTQDNKLDTGTKNNKLNEISLDSLAYIENAEQNNQEENQQQTDIAQSVNQGEKEETTPQLFTEEENADAPQKEVDFQKRSESLINEHEEEDFEIPAFLRKQKN
ncbi:MAG: cell division protein FtsZ [Candidatus Pelagibacter sp.]|nr:cell division protein FtsZ [Candidatus Pelagibacter sp.]|tara:strand:- start:29657 stop:31147 length:1491 start_codon:yes stop_codon:yes gene_type:complete